LNIPPTPNYTKDINRLKKHYKDAFLKTIALVSSLNGIDGKAQQQAILESQLRQMQVVMNELDTELGSWTEETLTTAYENAWVSAAVTTGIAKDLIEARQMVQFSAIKTHQMKAIVEDTFEDLLLANNRMRKEATKLIREIVADKMRQEIMMQKGYRDTKTTVLNSIASDERLKELLQKRVFVGIVDKSGRHWDMSTYVDTVVRTKFSQTQIQASTDFVTEHYDGDAVTDLAMISSHGAKDSCKSFEGMIVSLEGRTRGYTTLADVRASGLIFHPRCMHIVNPIGNERALSPAQLAKHNSMQGKADKAMANPQETKRQDMRERYQEQKRLEKEKQEKREQANANRSAFAQTRDRNAGGSFK
jgi:hypothetical protein